MSFVSYVFPFFRKKIYRRILNGKNNAYKDIIVLIRGKRNHFISPFLKDVLLFLTATRIMKNSEKIVKL